MQDGTSVEMRPHRARLDLDGLREMHLSFLVIARLIGEHRQQAERVEMPGRKLEQLPADRLGFGKLPGMLQRDGALVELGQLGLLFLLAAGIVERAQTDVLAHGAAISRIRLSIDDRPPPSLRCVPAVRDATGRAGRGSTPAPPRYRDSGPCCPRPSPACRRRRECRLPPGWITCCPILRSPARPSAALPRY